ncbi:MAG: hypothetical protein QNK23_17350 [Crocinitomicaceae bacterium]|nr:hypothetical protein [Crocinitomicaceae bacterium]
MKKVRLLTLAGLFALGSFGLTSCGGDEAAEGTEDTTEVNEGAAEEEAPAEEAPAEEEVTSTVMYQCPDNCSEGRAFFDPGTCDACGSEMVEI